MKTILRVEQPIDAPMHITWIINNICTKSCSYCPENLHSGKNHNYEWENARRFFKILFEKYESIHCTLAGGEPSVSPFFSELVQTFYNAGHSIGITSNAAKPVSFWSKNSQYLNYACFSYHPEDPDDKFIEKITEAGKHTYVTARIMMLPSKWDHCVEIYNKMKFVDNIDVEAVRILDWSGKDKTSHIYNLEQLEWFTNNIATHKHRIIDREISSPKITSKFYFSGDKVEDNPNVIDYINEGLTNFNGYQCEVGLKSLFIDWNGKIFLSNCCINGSIGSINDPENIKWPTSPVTCHKTICHCTTDVNINKWVDT